MKVFPAINCKDSKCLKTKIRKAADFLSAFADKRQRWIQIDICDGKFTKAKTKISPADIKRLKPIFKSAKLNLEVHLMVENPEKEVGKWLEAGAKRVMVHIEAIKNIKFFLKYKNKIGLAVRYSSPALKALSYLRDFKFILILGVRPGFSGQKLNPLVLEEIKWIKIKSPKSIIEVDGGINLKTAKLVKKAGADIIISGSYIWENKKPGLVYKKLSEV